MKKSGYIFLNAFLEKNLGDDLFVHIILNRYKEYRFQIIGDISYKNIFGNNAELAWNNDDQKKELRETHILRFFHMFHLPLRYVYPKFLRYANQKKYSLSDFSICNIYAIGSGFMENSLYDILDYFADYLYFRKNLYLIGCNFGPYYTDGYLKKHKKLFAKAMDVCVRDKYSYNLLKEAGNVRYAPDIVFSYQLGEDNSVSSKLGRYAVISVVALNKNKDNSENEENYLCFLLQCINYLLAKEMQIVVVGFCKNEGDDRIITQLMNRIPDHSKIKVYNYPDITYQKMMGIFKMAELVIASRYHAMIIGMLYRRKIYTLSYSNKIIFVLQDIDPDIKYINIQESVNVDIQDFFDHYGYRIAEERLSELKQLSKMHFLKLDELLFSKEHQRIINEDRTN